MQQVGAGTRVRDHTWKLVVPEGRVCEMKPLQLLEITIALCKAGLCVIITKLLRPHAGHSGDLIIPLEVLN